MKVVIDTNVFVAALSTFSQHHLVVEALVDELFELVISHDMLLEYEEKLLEKYNPSTVYYFLKLLEKSVNVHFIHVFYQWLVFHKDPDDNKFADAAFAAGVDHLVSDDRGFRVLKTLEFPRISLLTLAEFRKVLFPEV